MRPALTSIFVFLFVLPLSGQTGSAHAVPILLDAAIPKYPPIARAARIAGKVVVRVTVEQGLVVKTDVLPKPNVSSGQRVLETPTVENLKTWRFAPKVKCAFTVTYTYEISGTETYDLTNAKIEMLPSLDVNITERPIKPMY